MLAVGTNCKVTTKAFPDFEAVGTVKSVSLVPYAGTKYDCVVTCRPSKIDSAIMPTMTCELAFEVANGDDDKDGEDDGKAEKDKAEKDDAEKDDAEKDDAEKDDAEKGRNRRQEGTSRRKRMQRPTVMKNKPSRIRLIRTRGCIAIVALALQVVAAGTPAFGQDAAGESTSKRSKILDDAYDFSSPPTLPKIEAPSEGTDLFGDRSGCSVSDRGSKLQWILGLGDAYQRVEYLRPGAGRASRVSCGNHFTRHHGLDRS